MDSDEDGGGTELGEASHLGSSGKGLKREALGGGLKPQTRGRCSSGKGGGHLKGNSNVKQWGELGKLTKTSETKYRVRWGWKSQILKDNKQGRAVFAN